MVLPKSRGVVAKVTGANAVMDFTSVSSGRSGHAPVLSPPVSWTGTAEPLGCLGLAHELKARGMSKLEELKPNEVVKDILPDGLATFVSVQWFGSEAPK